MSQIDDPVRTGEAEAEPPGPEASQEEAIVAALCALPPDLRAALARLIGASDERAEASISLFDFAYRTLLETYGLIATSRPEPWRRGRPGAEEPRLRVGLTPLGRAVINACVGSAPVAERLAERARELRERYGAEVPIETREAIS